MSHRRMTKWLLSIAVVSFCCMTLPAPTPADAKEPYFKETVVAGGPDHFMEVRHVIIKGSNYAIGKKVAEIAKGMDIRPNPFIDPLTNKVQREYMEKNYPIFYQRMKGVADAYNLRLDDNRYDFTTLFQFPIGPPGCSVVFYPGSFTESGHSTLSRNYDFTTGTIMGRRPRENEVPVMSRPFIFELHPDEGYASLSICAFDLLGGVLDGINSEGLAVAILGDDETVMNFGRKPAAGIGMNELSAMRYLLDNCKDVDEAKESLLYLKHFYEFVPCHYIIADKNGRFFIFEFSPLRNNTHIIDGKEPQCITNHPVSNYQSIEEFPEESPINTYERYKTLHAAITGKKKFTIEEITAINASVADPGMAFDHPEYAPGRTLWHALYDIDRKSLSVKFYLGERPDASDPSRMILDYSDYLEFQLR